MGELTKQTTINATAATIFEYTANPHNAPNYVSSIRRIISGPNGIARGGESWQAEANFLGRSTNLTVRAAEIVEPKLVRFVLEGEPQSIMTVQLQPDGDNNSQTSVSLTLEVPSVPTMLLVALMNTMLTGDTDRLKGIMEG